MSTFTPADAHERDGLRSYLVRLLALDTRASVRLQGAGAVLGVWSGPPLDVVCLRPVRLAAALDALDPIDATVSAARLLERVEGAGPDVEVPASVAGPSWAGMLPPRTGWTVRATVPATGLYDAVRVGVEAFQRRVELVPARDRSRAALDAAAGEVWDQPLVAEVPLRAAHAAELMGLLGREGDVDVLEHGSWQRLACPGGSVAVRRGTGARLDLFAL